MARDEVTIDPKERMTVKGKTVRYLPVTVRGDGKRIALDEIIIGANQDTEETREQFKALLAAKGYVVGSVEYPRITVSDTTGGTNLAECK